MQNGFPNIKIDLTDPDQVDQLECPECGSQRFKKSLLVFKVKDMVPMPMNVPRVIDLGVYQCAACGHDIDHAFGIEDSTLKL